MLKGRKTNPGEISSDAQHICLSKPTYLPAREVLLSQIHYHRFKHHNPYKMTPEFSLGFCVHPHLCKQNFRKVISTFALEVTIKAVFELHFVSEPQLAPQHHF